jgi:hypothetical protein
MTRPVDRAGVFALVVLALAGCAAQPAAIVTLDDVTRERLATIEAAEQQRFADFMEQSGERLVEFDIPEPEFEGLVAVDKVDEVVSECIVTLNPRLQVGPSGGQFTVTYFGTVGDTYDRIRWTIDSCIAQYGVADLSAVTTAGPVEEAWRFTDTTHRVMPCLRNIGVTVPSPPSAEQFATALGTPREFSPFSLVAADPATLLRALALCPPSATVLQAHLDGVVLDTPMTGEQR